MEVKKVHLGKCNSFILYYDKSKNVPKEFIGNLENFFTDFLESEEFTCHLRNINIWFQEGNIPLSKLESIWQGNRLPICSYHPYEEAVIIPIDEMYVAYRFLGNALFPKLKPMIVHELFHYLHAFINKNQKRFLKCHERLVNKYKKRYAEFDFAHGADEVLIFLDLFVEKCISEGSAKFFERLRFGQIIFDEPAFEKHYNEALASAELLIQEYNKIGRVDSTSLEKFKDFAVFIKYDRGALTWYTLGFHIIYSIFYLSNSTISTDLKCLLKNFTTHFGRLKSKKLIDIYDALMRSHGKEPIITFKHTGGAINCHNIVKEWQSVFQ